MVSKAPLALAALALLTAGCDARVDAFEPSAHYVCPGQKVDLTWRVTGCATVRVTPPEPSLPDGPVDSNGHGSIAPVASTDVMLHVTRFLGHDTNSVQSIRVLQAPQTPEALEVSLADPSVGCDVGSDGKVWGTIHALRFSNDVKVATVSVRAGDNRTYQVEHAGVRATVSPGTAPDTDFAGKPIVGDWVLTSPLGAGESCGPSLPRNLGVSVFTQCVPGNGGGG